MKIYLDMIGCRLNQSEIEIMARQFSAAGHTLVGEPGDADLAVVNTCTVTAAAAADSRKIIRRIHRSGVERIITTGCWSSLQPEQARDLPGVTEVISNNNKSELVSILFPRELPIFDQEPILRVAIPGNRQRTRAFIKAQDGCRHSCTFCITTIARGKSRSESVESVVREVNAAVQSGIMEAVLTGVQLGSWGKDLDPPLGLHDLVAAVLNETGIPRLRLSSIEPWDIHPPLIELIQEDRVARHLHLPLQSGSAMTLRRMARAINPQTYQQLVDQIRTKIPGIAITTDILTGFPGETEAEYREGLDFIRQMEFAAGHVFTYSAREGTPAAEYQDQVPHPVRKNRGAEIRAILAVDGEKYRRGFLGKEMVTLWEQIEEDSNIATGLTDNYLRVEAEALPEIWNTFSRVKIQEITKDGVFGMIQQP